MIALIVSDNHGVTSDVVQIAKSLHFSKGFHCGDLCTNKEQFPFNKMELVRGNCDTDDSIPDEKIITWFGFRIFITHGHLYQVKSGFTKLFYRAKELDADVVMFGHSHFPVCFQEKGVLFINPGSLLLPRGFSVPTFAVLKVMDQHKKEVEVSYYQPNGKIVSSVGGHFLLRK
ncbi:metallophosphoesterase [Microaerobacter geothermalis]|uniref:YfcE family phosphodiesterase n=1 Tax=Microaerobacter geothermalis TaxID=674972 RepID=UPI001F21177D|nr:metallophosphoesterase [Microaerobacter geothermalis]MCF6092632.1 metallophosphoesterase [Microaerobacter geothermalis]